MGDETVTEKVLANLSHRRVTLIASIYSILGVAGIIGPAAVTP